jgi:type II secretory pathway component GspD/PulD (secretin)
VRDIPPNERWYIKDIPHDGNYVLCAFCFPHRDVDGNQLAPDHKETEEVKKFSYRPVDEVFTPPGARTSQSQRSRKRASGPAAKKALASERVASPKKARTKKIADESGSQAKTRKTAGGKGGTRAKNGKALPKTGKGARGQR